MPLVFGRRPNLPREETAMSDRSNVAFLPRVDRKLARRARQDPDPRDLSAQVAGTSEATAELFASEYTPESELGQVLNSPGPDGRLDF